MLGKGFLLLYGGYFVSVRGALSRSKKLSLYSFILNEYINMNFLNPSRTAFLFSLLFFALSFCAHNDVRTSLNPDKGLVDFSSEELNGNRFESREAVEASNEKEVSGSYDTYQGGEDDLVYDSSEKSFLDDGDAAELYGNSFVRNREKEHTKKLNLSESKKVSLVKKSEEFARNVDINQNGEKINISQIEIASDRIQAQKTQPLSFEDVDQVAQSNWNNESEYFATNQSPVPVQTLRSIPEPSSAPVIEISGEREIASVPFSYFSSNQNIIGHDQMMEIFKNSISGSYESDLLTEEVYSELPVQDSQYTESDYAQPSLGNAKANDIAGTIELRVSPEFSYNNSQAFNQAVRAPTSVSNTYIESKQQAPAIEQSFEPAQPSHARGGAHDVESIRSRYLLNTKKTTKGSFGAQAPAPVVRGEVLPAVISLQKPIRIEVNSPKFNNAIKAIQPMRKIASLNSFELNKPFVNLSQNYFEVNKPFKSASIKSVKKFSRQVSVKKIGKKSLNAFVFVRPDTNNWKKLSKLIYGDSKRAQDLKKWNHGVSLKPGNKIFYESAQKKSRQVKEAVSFYSDFSLNSAHYIVKKGDSLSKIAKAKWGSYQGWKEIYYSNKHITHPDKIEVGMKLAIVSKSLMQAKAEVTGSHKKESIAFQEKQKLPQDLAEEELSEFKEIEVEKSVFDAALNLLRNTKEKSLGEVKVKAGDKVVEARNKELIPSLEEIFVEIEPEEDSAAR